jgi:hypothetical protein
LDLLWSKSPYTLETDADQQSRSPEGSQNPADAKYVLEGELLSTTATVAALTHLGALAESVAFAVVAHPDNFSEKRHD